MMLVEIHDVGKIMISLVGNGSDTFVTLISLSMTV